MAFLTSPQQGTGANAPQGVASSLTSNDLQQGPLDTTGYTTTASTNLIIVPQVYSTPI